MVRVGIAKSSERYNGMPTIRPELETELETELTRARASKSKFLEERFSMSIPRTVSQHLVAAELFQRHHNPQR